MNWRETSLRSIHEVMSSNAMSEARLRRWSLIQGDSINNCSVHDDVRLERHGVQQYADAIRVLHLTFKNTGQMLKLALVDDHSISGLEFLERFHEAVGTDFRSHQIDDLVVDRSRFVVERDQTVDSSGVANVVILLVVNESSEDVAGKQRLGNPLQLAREGVCLLELQLRSEGFNSSEVQVAACALFLFRVRVYHVPPKAISGCVCHI